EVLAQKEAEPWLVFGVGVLGDRSGVLDEDRGLRNNPVEFLAILGREDRLVLVGQQDVARAAEEAGGGVAAAVGQRDDVGEELRDVVLGLGVGATVGGDVSPGGQRVPHAAGR